MSIITYVPAPGYTTSEQGIINNGSGGTFDVGAALTAGGGVITVDTSTNPNLAFVLDHYPGLVRQSISPGGNLGLITLGWPLFHSGGTPGQIPVLQSDGTYTPQSVTGISSLLSGLGDVTITTPTNTQVLTYNGTRWVNAAAPSGGGAVGMPLLTPTNVTSANSPFTASAGQLLLIDNSGGNIVVNYPSPANQSMIARKVVAYTPTNSITINAGGTNHFESASGPTSTTMVELQQVKLEQYISATGVWIAVGGDRAVGQEDARYLLATQRGAVNGVASLDASGQVPTAQLGLAPGLGLTVTTRNVTGSTPLAVDPRGRGFIDTLIGNTTYTAPTGALAGTECRIDMELKQDAVGNRTVTWWGGITWIPGVAPTIPTGASQVTWVKFLSFDGGATWLGSYDVGVTAPATPGMPLLTPTSVTFANSPFTAASGQFLQIDNTAGNVVINYPNTPADKTIIARKVVNYAFANTITINAGGTGHFEATTGATSTTMVELQQSKVDQYNSTSNIWVTLAGDRAMAQADSRYVLVSAKGIANGVASLDATGKVPAAQIPASGGGGGTSTGTGGPTVVFDTPEAHNAKRNGRVLNDITISAGTLGTVNSPSAPFTSASVGMTIMIAQAGNNGQGRIHITTIATFVSSTQVTLTAAAIQAVTGQVAVFGNDDTAAIKAAVSGALAAAVTANQYYAEVWFSAGIYIVAGALDQTQHGNAQIPLPYQAPAGMKMGLMFRGTGDNSELVSPSQTIPQMSGSVIVSALFPSGYDATHGIPSCIGGPTWEQGYGHGVGGLFSNMQFSTTGITVVLPVDHPQHGVDTFAVGSCNPGNLTCLGLGTVAGGQYWPNVTPNTGVYYTSNGFACGLVMPNVGNNNQSNIGLYSAQGLTAAIAIGERTTAQSIRATNCLVGVTFTVGSDGIANNNHSMNIDYLSTETCRTHIFVPPIGTSAQVLNIDNWDPGDAGEAISHITDNSNGLRGEIRINAQMVTQALIIGGTARVINAARATGAPVGGSPAVPASGTSLRNPYDRDASINIGGNTLTNVTIDGVAQAVIPGTYILPSRKSIVLTYTTTTPTWAWTLL